LWRPHAFKAREYPYWWENGAFFLDPRTDTRSKVTDAVALRARTAFSKSAVFLEHWELNDLYPIDATDEVMERIARARDRLGEALPGAAALSGVETAGRLSFTAEEHKHARFKIGIVCEACRCRTAKELSLEELEKEFENSGSDAEAILPSLRSSLEAGLPKACEADPTPPGMRIRETPGAVWTHGSLACMPGLVLEEVPPEPVPPDPSIPPLPPAARETSYLKDARAHVHSQETVRFREERLKGDLEQVQRKWGDGTMSNQEAAEALNKITAAILR